MSDRVQTVYKAFSPAPLTESQLGLYVPLDDVRGGARTVQTMAQRIRLADKPVSQVLAGHKGSGKSTELVRLKQALEAPGPARYFVVLCKADDDIDRNDVDFPEVLIAIVRQMAAQLREREGIRLAPGYIKDRWERLKGLLGSEISFDGIELDGVLAKISATIKASPNARVDMRRLLEPDTTNWLYAANDLIGTAALELHKKGYAGLVVLVDDLDKMVVRPREEAGCSTTEHLFVHRAAQLTAFTCHMVYTLPLSLAYSHHEQTIKASFGGEVPVVPMIKVATRPPGPKAYKPGIERMKSMIALRCKEAGIADAELFKSSKIEGELIRLSGGQPSELMVLVREALLDAGMPIEAAALERLRKAGRREYARILRQEHWPILGEVGKTGAYVRNTGTEPEFRELIDSRAILQYVNDDEWYGLNPMVAAIEPPARSGT